MHQRFIQIQHKGFLSNIHSLLRPQDDVALPPVLVRIIIDAARVQGRGPALVLVLQQELVLHLQVVLGLVCLGHLAHELLELVLVQLELLLLRDAPPHGVARRKTHLFALGAQVACGLPVLILSALARTGALLALVLRGLLLGQHFLLLRVELE